MVPMVGGFGPFLGPWTISGWSQGTGGVVHFLDSGDGGGGPVLIHGMKSVVLTEK